MKTSGGLSTRHCAKGTRETTSMAGTCIVDRQEQDRKHCITWKSEQRSCEIRTIQNNKDNSSTVKIRRKT